jgi:hypothetical protein
MMKHYTLLNGWPYLMREGVKIQSTIYWWNQCHNYPPLAHFALDAFGIPAMNSEHESVFSVARQLRLYGRVRHVYIPATADAIDAARCPNSQDEMSAIK